MLSNLKKRIAGACVGAGLLLGGGLLTAVPAQAAPYELRYASVGGDTRQECEWRMDKVIHQKRMQGHIKPKVTQKCHLDRILGGYTGKFTYYHYVG
ncbi:hypothetical protein LG293_17415 (plasmid) [Citricoccus nitrophenolicus]